MNSTRNRLRDCLCIACFALLAFPSVTAAQVRTKKPDRGVYQPPRVARVSAEPASRSEPRQGVPEIAERVRGQRFPESTTDRPRRELVDVTLDVLDQTTPTRTPTAKRAGKIEEPVSDYDLPALERVSHEEEVILAEPDASQPRYEEPISDAAKRWRDEIRQRNAGNVLHDSTCDGCPDCGPIGCDSIGSHAPWYRRFCSPFLGLHSNDSIGCDSIGYGSIGCDSTGYDSTGYDSIGCDPIGCDPIGCDPIGCDSIGCDSIGCDSIGCHAPWYRRNWTPSLGICSNDWFGSLEILLMFRSGDRLPPIVTTGPATDPDTAGELGQPGTQVLVGIDSILRDVTGGGRLTLGTWIDNRRCQSLVLRSWFAGEQTYGFSTNQNQTPVIARPFLNVSDNQAAEQDAFLVAFPNRATGAVDVRATSEVFGGDISVRQLWHEYCGSRVDLLYGYQYMRLNEDLHIASTSTSLDDDFAPIDTVISVSDMFDVENEFHGGQLGLAHRYREGCWSFDALAKVGFGSLRRRAKRSGVTVTSLDGATATDPNGLLVQSTNSGIVTDHTFGWVPEIDLSLGWQRYPHYDVTFGYHIIGMMDALQVSGAIDPNLAVNLSDPPTGQQRPSAALRYDSFYVQGIHFGIQHAY